MNSTSLPTTLVFVFSFLLSGSVLSQDFYASTDKTISTEQISSIYRLQKKLPAFHTGYVIEVATSEFPIQRSHPVYKRFGKVFYHKLPEGGYSYVIKANFSDLKSARAFHKNVVKPNWDEAKLIEYKKGERKMI